MRTLEQQAEQRAKNAAYQRAYRRTKGGRARLDSYQRSPKRRAVEWRKELKRCYGVTPEWYEATLLAQNYGCAVCGQASDKRRLAVDHDHTTGQVRGILCAKHNVMVGVLEHPDRPAMEDYLRFHGTMA